MDSYQLHGQEKLTSGSFKSCMIHSHYWQKRSYRQASLSHVQSYHYWQTTEVKLPWSYFDSHTIHTHLWQKKSYHQVAMSLVQCLVRTQDWPGSDSWHSQQSTFSWCKVVIDLHANNWGMLRRYLQHPSHWHLKVRAPWSNICLWGVWTRCFVIIRRSQVTSACHGSHEESWEESFSHPLISTPAPATKTH